MILSNNDITIGDETRNILINCKNDAYNKSFINVIIYFYQKVIEESLKRLRINKFYKELRFVDPKYLFDKSDIKLEYIINCMNHENKKQDISELRLIKYYFSDSEKIELPSKVLDFWIYVNG